MRRGRSPHAARQSEIVEEAVDNLWPWSNFNNRATVTACVKHELDVLIQLTRFEFSNQTQNKKHAKKLDQALGELERLLASAPGVLALSLFNPLTPPYWSHDDELVQPLTPKSIEEIKQAYTTRINSFAAELKRLRRICAQAIEPGIGYHPNFDLAKHTCAYFARSLMRGLSEKEVTSTADGPFRTITSLLYEAVTGKQDIDLKRACDQVLASARPLGTNKERKSHIVRTSRRPKTR